MMIFCALFKCKVSVNYIMIVYYINLEHRTDRRTHIENQLQGIKWPVERVEAVHHEYGILGCVRSHIKTLEQFLKTDHEECIVLEDDFEFTRPKEELYIPARIQWDVVMLSGNVQTQSQFTADLNQIYEAQTTSGYMITKNFAKILLENFREGEQLLEQTRNRRYSLDMHWKSLQPASRWFIFSPKFGKQCASYSDIEHFYANYGV